MRVRKTGWRGIMKSPRVEERFYSDQIIKGGYSTILNQVT